MAVAYHCEEIIIDCNNNFGERNVFINFEF